MDATPAPTATAIAASSPSPTFSALLPTRAPLTSTGAGEFVADCLAIRIRVVAPPRLMANPGACQGNSLFLTPNIAASDTEFLTVFRYANDARGGTIAGWADILDSIRRIDATSGDTAWSADDQPTARRASGRDGFIGTFARTDKGGVRYVGIVWAGQVGADTVAILLQGLPAARATLDADMARVLETIDLDAE